jgi:hypothetical protein
MMGFEIDGPTYAFGDNMSVGYNTSAPKSVLRKKCNSICYHAVHETVATGELIVVYIPGVSNPFDLLTKAVPEDNIARHLYRHSCIISVP